MQFVKLRITKLCGYTVQKREVPLLDILAMVCSVGVRHPREIDCCRVGNKPSCLFPSIETAESPFSLISKFEFFRLAEVMATYWRFILAVGTLIIVQFPWAANAHEPRPGISWNCGLEFLFLPRVGERCHRNNEVFRLCIPWTVCFHPR